MSQKSVNKSIRLTPELFEYINAYRGDGFNEKFENIILDAKFSENERAFRLESLEHRISEKEAVLKEVTIDMNHALSRLRRETDLI